MQVNVWGTNIECHVFEHNCGIYLETRTSIELRIGDDFMSETVKRISTCIGGCTVFYDCIDGRNKIEKYMTIINADQYNYQFGDPR